MKKVMCLLATAVLLMAAVPLSAQEDVAVKKVIPDALTAFASFDFTTMWSFWCEDGFIEKGGAKRTIPDLKKDDKYLKILDLSKMRQAKSLDELVDLMVQSGDMTAEQKTMILALPDEQKKQAFNAMQQAIKMQEAMAKMAVQGIINTMQYKSLKIEGDTAVAEIFVDSPFGGGGDAIVTFKKVKGAWKIYSVQEKPLPAQQKK